MNFSLFIIFIPTFVSGQIQEFRNFLHILVLTKTVWESKDRITIDRNFPGFGLNTKLHLSNTTIELENPRIEFNSDEYFCNILVPSLSFFTDFKLKYMLNGKESNYNGQIFSTFTNIYLEINNLKPDKNDYDSCNAYVTMETAKFDVKLMNLDLSEFISNYLNKYFVQLLKRHKNILIPYISKEIRNYLKYCV